MDSSSIDRPSVFLNVPYDRGYEPLFVTLVTTLVCLGLKPRCVLEVRETGRGRLARIFELLHACGISIHDLSRVGPPPRWNMPFELGLAWSLVLSGIQHEVIVLDSTSYRLDKHLSDYKGRDQLIHHNRCDDLVNCILDLITVPHQPAPSALRSASRFLRSSAREIIREYPVDN